MNYPADYFNSEIIEGFEVSSMMKRCWAAQMEVLEIFDNICRQRSIKYFLAYGTLLGAVRHKGFIPWDDDIDIWMPRDDIDRLMREYQFELSASGLELVTPYSDNDYENLAFRLVNTRHSYCLTEDFLKKYWLFPFMAGIDIFTLDYVPRDEIMLKDMSILMVSANVLAQEWNNEDVSKEEKMSAYEQLTGMLGVEMVSEESVPMQLWQLTDRIGAMFSESDADMLATWGYYIKDTKKIFKKEWFSNVAYLEFEGVKLPCPSGYEDVLKNEFGDDYMIPKLVKGDHEYPYYKGAHEFMVCELEKNGIKCPEIYKNI